MTNVSWRTIIAICLLGLPVTAGSQTLTTIYSFPNRPTGSGPGALSYRNGTLYGTTELGGASNSGALFRLNVATNHEKTLYSFPTDNNNLALSSLLINGSTIYGNSYYGGPNPCIGGGACGTIFSFSSETGAADVLYTFTGTADGAHPNPGLIYANGLIYGTTAENGQGNGCCGTLFSLDPSTGSLSVLYTFGASQYDAVRPAYGPIKVGNFLYGATEYGGRWDKGAIFAFNLSKGTERVLYSFGYYVGDSNPFTSDGILPEGGLIYLNGVLYGTTAQGGLYDNCYYGCGTVFGVNIATAKEDLFYAFPGTSGDVYEPAPQLVDQSGVLYGMGYGGEFGDGAIFSLDPATATEKTLYSFPAALGAQLSLSLNGLIYGTTIQGGTAACGGKGCGTIFTFSP